VVALNHGLDPEYILEGQTILLPAGSLSSRDKEILGGIGPRSYRTYPVRAGETIEAITKPRKISMEEVEALNPGMNLNKLEEGQVSGRGGARGRRRGRRTRGGSPAGG